MSAYLRRSISKMIVKSLNQKGNGLKPFVKNESLEDILTSCLRFRQVTKKTSIHDPQIHINLTELEKKVPGLCLKFLTDIQCVSKENLNLSAERIDETKGQICFTFRPCQLSEVVMRRVLSERDEYGCCGIVPDNSKQTILVEYSSPNIAKPFHAGHLRSSVIGNFISNLYESVGHKVIRVNYLGDWGTQYGLLSQGYKKYGDEEELKKDPMKHLFMVYVKINKDMKAETMHTIGDKHDKGEIHRHSMEIFQKMEQGNSEEIKLWQKFKDLSIEKYKEIYKRLNVKFTEYEGESMYSKKSLDLMEQLKQRGLLHIDETTGQGYIDIKGTGTDYEKAVVQKSDGSTLYLTRDITAALDRHSRYKFDKIHYVVEDGQQEHFKLFIAVLQKLDVPWIERCRDKFHIKFGRIGNISTRKGTAVFLEDILDEARERMITKMKDTQTTKVVDSIEDTADVLGVSSIIVQDLKARRQNSYKFSWDKVLSFKGDSGVALQYAHARLCSLIKLCGSDEDSNDFDSKYLTEPEAVQLILHIARYEDVIEMVLETLEACHIVDYLFNLVNFINAAHRKLKVKDESKEIAQARLQLFRCAKTTMANGLKVLGITPLDKM